MALGTRYKRIPTALMDLMTHWQMQYVRAIRDNEKLAQIEAKILTHKSGARKMRVLRAWAVERDRKRGVSKNDDQTL